MTECPSEIYYDRRINTYPENNSIEVYVVVDCTNFHLSDVLYFDTTREVVFISECFNVLELGDTV